MVHLEAEGDSNVESDNVETFNSGDAEKPTVSGASQACHEGDRPIFWEIFAGCSRLSAHFDNANFQSLPVDHEGNDHQSEMPQLLLDLRDPSAQEVLLGGAVGQPPQVIHFAMPCGTGSRARDRKIPEYLKKRGAPEPPPLKSASHPLGVPNLSSFHQAKVDSSNQLLKFVVLLLYHCFQHHIHVVLENPDRSWIWAALAELIRQHSDMLFRRWYSQLFDLVFGACEHGGGRPKQTRFLTTVPTLMQLQKQCSGNHKHLPYNISWDNNKWNFDTSKEAEYPHLLCQRYVSFVCQHLKLPTPPAVSKRHSTCLATAQQPRIAQLIPEFVHINTVAKSKLPADTSTFKILESLNTTGDHKREGESMVRVGKYHTMKQFFDKAKSLPHPFSTHNAVSDEVKSVIFDIFSEGITATASWRIKQIDRISKMKHEMRFEEARFKAGLPAHVQEVLGGKPILLWKKLLQETNFPDLGVVDFMHGVPLTGRHSKSPLFGEKVVLAKTTTELLVASSKWRNKALLARVAHSDDPKLQQVLWEETMKECSKGFINGPFQTLES